MTTEIPQFDRRTLFKLLAASTGTMVLGERTALGQMAAPNKTLCEQLGAYVAGLRFETIPGEVISKAQDVILHLLTVAFGGVGTDEYHKALAVVEQHTGRATVIGQSFKASAADAAFVNTIATRAMRMEDSVVPSFTHPGACLLPTALALAEQNGNSGREVLTAVIAGYDVINRIHIRSDHHLRSPSHIFGPVAVAATAAKMMRLDTEQTVGALAHACNLGALIAHGFEDFQYGIVTRHGMLAAALGKARAPFPRDALEGPEGLYAVQLQGQRPTTEKVLSGLGTRFDIMSAYSKPHPCTFGILVPTEMMRRLVSEYKLTDDSVKKILVKRSLPVDESEGRTGPFKGYLNGRFEASSSLPFALAVTLVDGEVTIDHFDNPNDPRFVPALHKVAIETHPEFDLEYHEIIVERTDGTVVSLKGGAEFHVKPDDYKLLERWARPKVGEAKVKQLMQRVAELDRAPNVSPLMRCLV